MAKVNYNPLVEKVLSSIRIKNKLLNNLLPQKQFFDRPFITIAREPGSGGAPIAAVVAKRLNFELKDKTIVERLSELTKTRQTIIEDMDEKKRTQLEEVVHSVLNPEYISGNTLIKELTKFVLACAHQGNCVILGRGANFMTPSAKGLHVNIVAPYEVRVQRAMQYEGFDRKKARKVIARVEKERADFVKSYFRRDIKRQNSYDLTLNTHYYTIDEAADIVITAFKRKFPILKKAKAKLF